MPWAFAKRLSETLLRFCRDHGSIFQKAGVQADTINLLQKYHADTWVSQEGLADIAHVVRGTIAGNPLEGLIFWLLFTHVVQDFRAQLLSEGEPLDGSFRS